MTNEQRASFTVDGVSSFVDELPVDMQKLFAQVILLRNKREEAALEHVAMQRAVDHAETQLVGQVRDFRNKPAEEVAVTGEVV